MPHLLRIGELAATAGVSPRTVDYYTQLGLIQPAGRTDGGFRMYDPHTAETIATIKQLESYGISLDDIVGALSTTNAYTTNTLTRLATDLAALQDATAEAPNAHALLSLITGRAHALIEMALQITNSPLI